MKKFITLITSAALAVTSLCAVMPAYAETDKADEAAGSEGFSYTVNDGSVVFTSTNDTYFVINSVTTEYDSGYDDTYSYRITPQEEGNYLVSAVTESEKIITYNVTDEVNNHFHFFCPDIKSYMLTYTEDTGITVKLIEDSDLRKKVDLEKLKKEYAEKDLKFIKENPDISPACFSVNPYNTKEILETEYLSFVKSQIGSSPYFRHVDMFNNITDELVVTSIKEIMYIEVDNESNSNISDYLDETCTYTESSSDSPEYNDITYTLYKVNNDITDDFTVHARDTSAPLTSFDIPVKESKFDGSIVGGDCRIATPPPPHPEGDVNYDGEVNIADLLWLENYLSGRYDNGVYDVFPNVNGDDKVNVFDLVVLRQLVMENITSQYAFSFRADVTDLADYKANEAAAAKKTYKITSPTELSATLKPLFSETVLREMDKRYDKNFFQENVLLLRIGNQTDNGYISKISGIKVSDENELDITIDRFDTNSDTADGIVLYQVSVPKADYSTLKNINWHEQIIDGPWIDPMKVVDIPLNTFSFGLYFPDLYHELWGEKHKAYSLDEFTELLTTESGDCYLPQINEKAATVNKTSADGEKITFDENLFKDNFVYFYVSTAPIDETYFCEYTEGNNTLTINNCSSLGFGDTVNEFLNVFIIPKTVDKDAEIVMDTHKQVNYRVITLKNRSSINDLGPFTTFVDSSKNYNSYINVCKHTFGDTSSVAFYTFQVPSLGVPANNSFLHELPIKEGTAPFACDKLIYDAPLSGDNYTITFDTPSGDIELTSDDFLEYRGYRLSYSGNYSITEMFK